MRDDQRGAAQSQAVECLADFGFADRVEVRRCFVQDQDGRVFEQRAGNRHALALAARQLQAALADGRVVALR